MVFANVSFFTTSLWKIPIFTTISLMEWNSTSAESFQIDPFVVAFQADLTMVGQLFTVACVVISRRKPQKPGDTMCLNAVYERNCSRTCEFPGPGVICPPRTRGFESPFFL